MSIARYLQDQTLAHKIYQDSFKEYVKNVEKHDEVAISSVQGGVGSQMNSIVSSREGAVRASQWVHNNTVSKFNR